MIQVTNLTKRFHSGGQEVLAVNRLSFSIGKGEVYGLLGPNGAGKTTTIRMIVGLLQPDEGYALVDGFRSSSDADEVKARLGLVSANDGIYPWLTVREMLLFFADLYGVSPDAAAERLDQLVALFDLGDYLNRRCSVISTGQRQRVIMARALMHSPPVMLLDEPTRGLDVVGSQVVFDYIQYLREQGVAVLVSTHRLDEAQRLCNRFGLLHQGRLWQEGTLAELQRNTGCNTLVAMFTQLFRGARRAAPPAPQTFAPQPEASDPQKG